MKRVLLFCVVGLIALVGASVVSAKVVREPFEAFSTLVGREPGAWTYPGGNIHVRGMVEYLHTTSDDPRVCGDHILWVNANWNAEGYGPIWGTYRLDVAGLDGHWEGRFTGEVSASGVATKMRGVGHGDLAGLRIAGIYANGVTQGVVITLPNH